MEPQFSIVKGFSEPHLSTAASLYDAAFGAKYGIAIPDTSTRLKVLEESFCLEFCMAAFHGEELVGIAGVKTNDGSFTGGFPFSMLKRHLGWWGACRALLILAMFNRKTTEGELLMDGICVSPDWRGHGIGTRLLDAVLQLGRDQGSTSVRLDVIDTNPNARRLYERVGFVVVRTERFPYLKWLLKFSAATQMQYRLSSGP